MPAPAAYTGAIEFVLQVQSPAPATEAPVDAQPSLSEAENSRDNTRSPNQLVGRYVVRTLLTAIDAAEEAATAAARSGDVNHSMRAYRSGVSANLCNAMASLERMEWRFLDLTVELSPVLSADPEERSLFTKRRRLHGGSQGVI